MQVETQPSKLQGYFGVKILKNITVQTIRLNETYLHPKHPGTQMLFVNPLTYKT
jgi:hypothetical protein